MSIPALANSDAMVRAIARSAEAQTTALWFYAFESARIIWANRAALALWGADSVETLAARELRAEMSPAVAARLRQYQEDFRNTPDRSFHETWTLYPKGEPVYLSCTFRSCVLDDGRECTAVEGIVPTRPEPAMLRSLDALMHSQVMTGLYARDGSELYANRALREVLGAGRPVFEGRFTDPEAAATFRAGLERDGTYRARASLTTGSGPRWFDIHAVNCRDAATGEAAFQVSAIDITTAHKTREALVKARDRALSADRAKSEFLTSISHEMRTPLHGVLGMVELLGLEVSDPQQRDKIQSIRASGESLLDMIEDVLDLSSIDLRAMQLVPAPFVLRTVVQRLADSFAEPAGRKALRVQVAIDETVPEMCLGDARRLTQVLRNLVGNAIKFTPAGHVEIAVAQVGNGDLQFAVRDTGPGVAPADRDRIFERFQKVGPCMAHQSGGVGLGLSLSRDLIGLFGGKIEVGDAVCGGAEFRFTLPGAVVPDLAAPGATSALVFQPVGQDQTRRPS